MLQEVLPLTDPSQVFAQIPLVAIRMMQGVDPSHITVGPPLAALSPAAAPAPTRPHTLALLLIVATQLH